jgi:hypothetical protein
MKIKNRHHPLKCVDFLIFILIMIFTAMSKLSYIRIELRIRRHYYTVGLCTDAILDASQAQRGHVTRRFESSGGEEGKKQPTLRLAERRRSGAAVDLQRSPNDIVDLTLDQKCSWG